MFSLMQGLFPVLFIIVLGIILFAVVRGIKEWSHNNAQPKIPARARVVAKRTSVSHSHHHAGAGEFHHMHTSNSSTSYYVTFEFMSGDRLELSVPSREYGMIAEGDSGTLTSQGTRFISFEREM